MTPLLGYWAVPAPSFCTEIPEVSGGTPGIIGDPVYILVRLLGMSASMFVTPVASPTPMAGSIGGPELVHAACPPGPVQGVYVPAFVGSPLFVPLMPKLVECGAALYVAPGPA